MEACTQVHIFGKCLFIVTRTHCCQQAGITLEKEKGFQNGMLQDPQAPLKSNFASVSEMVDKDAGSLSRTSAESLSVILSPRDFEGEL
jgi:hypothetical protein